MRTDQNTVHITYFHIAQSLSLKAAVYSCRGGKGIGLKQANFTMTVTFHLFWYAACECKDK